MINSLYNMDCIEGAKTHLADNSIDLILTDPPYGIEGQFLHKHYNRDENNVLDGYIEIPQEDYEKFSEKWIAQAERVLRPGGSIYIVSGYTNLRHILNALAATSLKEVNHIIWKYNFGVYTKNKYISSHYHILFYEKPGGNRTFNKYTRYGSDEYFSDKKSMNYTDREDVWSIKRDFKKGQVKNKNQLPTELLKKIILYSSNEGDRVCDFFLGGFGTAKIAIGLGRKMTGFEKSRIAYEHNILNMDKIKPGELLGSLRTPKGQGLKNSGKRWLKNDIQKVEEQFDEYLRDGSTKSAAIEALSEKYQRGKFGILNILKKSGR
ncbi:MAG: site-specific DNA-methyltransferase [Candidatus Marinimicrobia bacterium]|nr:site-specific DNA-methyltransferase [Candidatus Neomarinimicrobiota bacterium]